MTVREYFSRLNQHEIGALLRGLTLALFMYSQKRLPNRFQQPGAPNQLVQDEVSLSKFFYEITRPLLNSGSGTKGRAYKYPSLHIVLASVLGIGWWTFTTEDRDIRVPAFDFHLLDLVRRR